MTFIIIKLSGIDIICSCEFLLLTIYRFALTAFPKQYLIIEANIFRHSSDLGTPL